MVGFVDDYPRIVDAHSPQRSALICGSATTTYAQLEARTRQVALGLQEMGLEPGDRVAWIGRNTAEFFEVLLGAARAGLVTVPVNWRLAAPELRALLRDAAPGVVFCTSEFLPLLADATPIGARWRRIGVHPGSEYEAWRDAPWDARPPVDRSDEDCFLQLYTSGTTGEPKGVRLSHRAIFARRAQEAALGAYYAWADHETILVAAPVFHIAGVGWALAGLQHGATCVIHAELEPGAMLDAVRRYRIQRLFAAPVVLRWMIDRQRADPSDLSSLRLFLYGSAPISPASVRAALEVMPDCGFMHVYGMTEMAGSQVCMGPAEHDPQDANRLMSCGRPLPGVALRIVDTRGDPVPAGTVGEIELRSEARMLGYWNQPELTERAFHDGWYRTGDAGRLDAAGYLYIVDRVKDMIVSGGENVYPMEVENALHTHPAIASAAVIGRPHETWGEAVHAVVELRQGASTSTEELIAFLRPLVAGYKIPRSYDFVASMPLTASGKIKKHELRQTYWKNQPRGVN